MLVVVFFAQPSSVVVEVERVEEQAASRAAGMRVLCSGADGVGGVGVVVVVVVVEVEVKGVAWVGADVVLTDTAGSEGRGETLGSRQT